MSNSIKRCCICDSEIKGLAIAFWTPENKSLNACKPSCGKRLLNIVSELEKIPDLPASTSRSDRRILLTACLMLRESAESLEYQELEALKKRVINLINEAFEHVTED